MINSDDIVSLSYLLDPCFQFQNTAGKPLTEGYIEVYIAGTRDKYYCASDFDGTLHPFQIPLDSLGANIVLADPDQAYDVYVYNKFGSLQMSRYNVSPGNAGGAVASNINITSSDNTVNVTHIGNNYDLSIQDTIDRIDNLENIVSGITGETDYVISTGYGDGGTFVLTDKEYNGIQYLSDMSGWRLKPGHIYQFNFNSKFTLDDNYNTLVEGKLYLDGDMSFSQDWSFSLDDSFDHIKHINGSTVIVVPNTLQYYDLKLKYTFTSVVNCQVDLENVSLVDITSIVLDDGSNDYHAGDGININDSNYISVDMDYINNQIDIDSKLSSAINMANEYTDNSIVEVISSVSAATATLEQEIHNIPPQVQSDWAQTNASAVDYIKNKPEEETVEFTELVAGQNISITASGSSAVISANIDLTNYATHNEVYTAASSAVSSANSYTDTAIANIDLTPAVEIVSPNNTISVSSVTDSANNTKTFYIDTNNPDVNYWLGESRFTLSDQSSQGQVGYYKEVFDYADKLNGNLDATKLKKGLYLLTANVMIVADEVNNDLAEIQILSNSTSAISNTNSIFQHDCSIVGDDEEPGEVSHQIATIVRVVYDDTPISLIARLNAPTYISNELHLWFGDIGLYELQGTYTSGGSSPSASGSYDAGWGIVINGNVISVNQSIIPDISNLATNNYVDNRMASAISIVEGEIPDVSSFITSTQASAIVGTVSSIIENDIPDTSDMATKTWVVNQGYLTSVPSQYVTDTELSNELEDYALVSAIPDVSDMATKTWVGQQGFLTSIPSTYATDTEVSNAIATATNDMATQTWVGNQGYLTSIPSQYITETELANELEDYALVSAIPDVSDMATKTWVGQQGYITTIPSEYATDVEVSSAIATATSGMATQSWVSSQGYLTSVPSTYATDAEVSAAIATATTDMATQTWVGNQGYLTSVPSQYITETELSSELADYALKTDIPDPVSGASGVKVEDSIVSLDNPIGLCAGENITITVSGDSAIISGQAGGSTYTAGTGIDITSGVISVTDPNKLFIAEYGVTTSSQMSDAINAGKVIVCKYTSGETGTVYLPSVRGSNNIMYPGEILFQGEINSLGTPKCLQIIFTSYWGTPSILSYDPLQVQANWNESDSTSKAYIQNKPDLTTFVTSSQASAIAEAEVATVISVPPTSGLDTTKHYYLTWDNTNGVHWEVGDLGEIETALANL